MDAQERIERYLSDNMSSTEQKIFEIEIKQNKALAEEVEFQRGLMDFFNDYEPELEGVLEGLGEQHFVAETTSNPPPISNGFSRKLWFIPISLLFLLSIWLLFPTDETAPIVDQNSTETQQIEPPKKEVPIVIPETAPVEQNNNTLPEETEPEPSKKPTESTERDIIIGEDPVDNSEQPIASLNPKDFKSNPTLESILQEQVRDEGFSTKITKPVFEQEFKSGKTITLLLNGTTTAKPPYEFIIYSNRSRDFDNDYKTLSAIVNSSKVGDAYPVKFNANIPLESGLYYWILRQKKSEEVLHISKFLVK